MASNLVLKKNLSPMCDQNNDSYKKISNNNNSDNDNDTKSHTYN